MSKEIEKMQTINTVCSFIKKIPIVEGIVVKFSKFEDNTLDCTLLLFTNSDSSFVKKTTGIDCFSESENIKNKISDLLFSKRAYDGFCETPDIVPSPNDIELSNYDQNALDIIDYTVANLSSTLDSVEAMENDNYKRRITEYNEKLSNITKKLEENGIRVKINPYCEKIRRDNSYYIVKEYANQQGLDIKSGFGSPSVSNLMSWAQNNGVFNNVTGMSSSERTAFLNSDLRPGDVIIWNSNGASHTGIIKSINNDGTFETIEGNSSDQVKSNHKSINDKSLTGFIKFSDIVT